MNVIIVYILIISIQLFCGDVRAFVSHGSISFYLFRLRRPILMANLDNQFNLVCDALSIYKEKYGNLLVPQKYVIPANDTIYPPNLRGLKLGLRVKSIRQAQSYTSIECSAKLDRLGFVWDYYSVTRKNEFKLLLACATMYTELVGDISLIPYEWVVPRYDEAFLQYFYYLKVISTVLFLT